MADLDLEIKMDLHVHYHVAEVNARLDVLNKQLAAQNRKLDAMLEFLKEDTEDKAKMAAAREALRVRADALKAASEAANTPPSPSTGESQPGG